MILGRVQNLHALVPVTFRLLGRPDLTIEFVIDTGFAGFLTLPPVAISTLGLPYQFDTPANLADDSEVQLPVHEATILWTGGLQAIRVLATGRRPLLGMALLAGHELSMRCVEEGFVRIDPELLNGYNHLP